MHLHIGHQLDVLDAQKEVRDVYVEVVNSKITPVEKSSTHTNQSNKQQTH